MYVYVYVFFFKFHPSLWHQGKYMFVCSTLYNINFSYSLWFVLHLSRVFHSFRIFCVYVFTIHQRRNIKRWVKVSSLFVANFLYERRDDHSYHITWLSHLLWSIFSSKKNKWITKIKFIDKIDTIFSEIFEEEE